MNIFTDITFANKELFYLLLLIPLLVVWYVFRNRKQHATIQLSTLRGFEGLPVSYKSYLQHALFGLRMLAIAAIITAIARPQSSTSWKDVTTEGIDIVIALDISGSMLAEDFKPNRLEASKNVAMEFIQGRPNDRMGLVVYSGESFTQSPLTTDHSVLINLFKDIKFGMIEDGTALGEGLATSVSRLKDSDAKSKVVILLTDGVNNAGSIPPLTAAEIAKEFGVRVYTIGVGTKGQAPYPVKTPFGTIQYQYQEVNIDEESLQGIATTTDGKYFRATNNNKLKEIYNEIDQLEKSKIKEMEYNTKKEEFLMWAVIAGILLLSEILLRNTLLRTVP